MTAQFQPFGNFLGRSWEVKSGTGGPRNNNWSADNAIPNADGTITLKLTKANDMWFAGEIRTAMADTPPSPTEEPFFYTLAVWGPLATLGRGITFGIFLFDDDGNIGTDDDPLNEIDIEYSDFAPPNNVYYTVYPAVLGPSSSYQAYQVAIPTNLFLSENEIQWRSDFVVLGSSQFSSPAAFSSTFFQFLPTNFLGLIPQQKLRFHINLFRDPTTSDPNGPELSITIGNLNGLPFPSQTPSVRFPRDKRFIVRSGQSGSGNPPRKAYGD